MQICVREWPTMKTIKGHQILKLAGADQRGKWRCWEIVMVVDYYYGNIRIQLCHSFFWNEALGFPFPSIKCTALQKPNMTFMSSDSLCSLAIFSTFHRHHFRSGFGSLVFKPNCVSGACFCRLYHWLTGNRDSNLQLVACDKEHFQLVAILSNKRVISVQCLLLLTAEWAKVNI